MCSGQSILKSSFFLYCGRFVLCRKEFDVKQLWDCTEADGVRYLKSGDGEPHFATQLAQDLTRFIPDLAYPDFDWRPKDFKMELVEGFDRGSVNYIN